MSKKKILIFTGIVLVCLAFAGLSIFHKTRSLTSKPTPTADSSSTPEPSQEKTIAFLKSESGDVGSTGHLAFASFNTLNSPQILPLQCMRMHYSNFGGICLTDDPASMAAKAFITKAIFFDPTGKETFSLSFPGIPSRTRISADGTYATVTSFVSGDAYTDAEFSTRAYIIDTNQKKVVANLEEFAVYKNDKKISKVDFNFWGVTFVPGTDEFYATLKYDDIPHLVKGSIGSKKVQVLQDNVECPSLSPDGTRIAFKKPIQFATWKLATLDLASGKITELLEQTSVDDQVEWLNNDTLLYATLDVAHFEKKIMQIKVDGKSGSSLYINNAFSPAVFSHQ